jgi:hypothetical protein|tara:strand:+ start:502 stop:1113 length:612 start_codon:yes stop_codon:yes gene_type:complete
MNVRLHYEADFTAGFYYNEMLKMNNYKIRLWMITATSDGESHNIAFDRIKYFIGQSLDSGVFINNDHEEQCKLLANAGVKIITLPAEPVDQLIGIMLYCKLNAICEERILIGEVEITSELGGEVTYMHAEDEPIGPYDNVGWWNDANLIHYHSKITETENIVSLATVSSWRELGLHWPEDDEEDNKDTGNTIVFGNFNKDETE